MALQTGPSRTSDPIPGWIHERHSDISAGFLYAYATLWFSMPLIVFNLVFSRLTIFAARWGRRVTVRRLPGVPAAVCRRDLFLVLGEQHDASPHSARRAAVAHRPGAPRACGRAIIAAMGTGDSSACTYPYIEQLPACSADDPAGRLATPLLEVTADFLNREREIWQRRGLRRCR
jgi:hypothetical protein